MTPETNKKTAPKKINWGKAQRIAGEFTMVATTAFLSGLAMAAGQRMINGYFNRESGSDNSNVVSFNKARTAI